MNPVAVASRISDVELGHGLEDPFLVVDILDR